MVKHTSTFKNPDQIDLPANIRKTVPRMTANKFNKTRNRAPILKCACKKHSVNLEQRMEDLEPIRKIDNMFHECYKKVTYKGRSNVGCLRDPTRANTEINPKLGYMGPMIKDPLFNENLAASQKLKKKIGFLEKSFRSIISTFFIQIGSMKNQLNYLERMNLRIVNKNLEIDILKKQEQLKQCNDTLGRSQNSKIKEKPKDVGRVHHPPNTLLRPKANRLFNGMSTRLAKDEQIEQSVRKFLEIDPSMSRNLRREEKPFYVGFKRINSNRPRINKS